MYEFVVGRNPKFEHSKTCVKRSLKIDKTKILMTKVA